MRVGTDGVLLGAWAAVEGAERILDIGCGSGLVGLMAAQRAAGAQVWGIDVDEPSLLQARQNARLSPWAERLHMELADVRQYFPPLRFTHLLCNPPYHTEDTLPPIEARGRARHTAHLSLEELLRHAARLGEEDALFSLILPTQTESMLIALALCHGWHVARSLRVRTVARKPPKRTLLTLQHQACPYAEPAEMVLQMPDGHRTREYELLCGDFYLKKGE